MSMSVDSPRRPADIRRPRRRNDEPSKPAPRGAGANLPVPVGAPVTIASGPSALGGAAAIEAQVIGERRGLRAGPTIHDEAAAGYNRVEWSGAYDRRRTKGGAAKTRI
jgi:hypothetical protein